MQLNKFGAILKFGIDLEQHAVDFYETAARARPGQGHEESAKAARKRQARLERMRRELVNGMLLEPISDFNPPDLPALGDDLRSGKESADLETGLKRSLKTFYEAASTKIVTVAPAVSRAFKKTAASLQR